MYSLIVRDYSIADIEAFSALSIRRGSTIASLAKASSDNLRIVTGAWLLLLPKAADEAAVRASAERFLAGPGAWMNETPEGLVAAALESGLLEKTFEGFSNGLAPRPNVTAARLTDELETAAAILELVDGRRDVAAIIAMLNERFPEAGGVDDDVIEFLQIACQQKWITCREPE